MLTVAVLQVWVEWIINQANQQLIKTPSLFMMGFSFFSLKF